MKGATQQYDSYAWQVELTSKENSTSSLLYKLAMPDNQFMFSSSSLLRPRFELRTLAGYSLFHGKFRFYRKTGFRSVITEKINSKSPYLTSE